MIRFEITNPDFNPKMIFGEVIQIEDGYIVEDEHGGKITHLEALGLIKRLSNPEVPPPEEITGLTTEVTQIGNSDPHFRIKILDKNFMLTLPQLMRPTEFRKQFLCHFGTLIDIKPQDWREIVTYWMSTRNIGTELSPDDEIRERILEHLCECRVYKSTKQTVTSRRALFWDEAEPEKIYCPAHALQEMLAEEGRQTSMTKLHFILVDYLGMGSVVKRVGAVTRRFWQFDLKKVGIDLEHQLVEEKEPEEKEDGV